MDKPHPCPICYKHFSRIDSMKRHLETIHDIDRTDKENNHECPTCHKTFTRASYMKKHQETAHNAPDLISKITELQSELKEIDEKLQSKLEETTEQLMSELKERDEQLKSEFKELKTKPNSQVLNIICVTGNDNYLDMLTDQMGNFDRAIDYIKGCALSDLVGDCKLIDKIYANQDHELSFTINLKRSKVTYHNEQQQLVTENKDVFVRKIANNLQNSYLEGVNFIIHRNLDRKFDPNKLLDEYDLMTWNHHIYQLSNCQYQHKLLGQLSGGHPRTPVV